MTDIQVKYWGLLETGRHNLAEEGETERSHKAGESISLMSLSESQRHNVETERQGWEDVTSRRWQALASQDQARASQQQAQAALSQASSARIRALSDSAFTDSRTLGQNINNEIADKTKIASIVSGYAGAAGTLAGIASKIITGIVAAKALGA